ncbi:hypothetical protein M4D70_25750 [Brevibacillus borstelensis]|uniref:hypothetical protein n=1 Tax=Brevibacillus borstelensis TaxID=45462 RepID=UPI00203B0BB8|nr:hypothetical protein [Brevibacillus borstelensis]MCM3625580.1 hypothetical protein [Brevibacillus borstelensis]
MKYLDIIGSSCHLPVEELEQRFDEISEGMESLYMMHGYVIGLDNPEVDEAEIYTVCEELLESIPQVANVSIQGNDILGYCPKQFPITSWSSERTIAWELKRIEKALFPDGQFLFSDAYVLGEVYLVPTQKVYYDLMEYFDNHSYLGDEDCPVSKVLVRLKPEYQ